MQTASKNKHPSTLKYEMCRIVNNNTASEGISFCRFPSDSLLKSALDFTIIYDLAQKNAAISELLCQNVNFARTLETGSTFTLNTWIHLQIVQLLSLLHTYVHTKKHTYIHTWRKAASAIDGNLTNQRHHNRGFNYKRLSSGFYLRTRIVEYIL